ncbi:acyl carrier protein [Actinokineospora iranica]|uniref:Polyketide biosynthesis acyl carrier protein n=1 Tax=Actinokineospora iranica TaxID=1271860 RepID=A0A1G6W8D3_9PSEU|nr:acyl carrier protein [Actinokineospora iranica]SDD61953.1 polyketide biosynthesis acyl carrier protein [Actinokineospora iranica]
MTASTSPRQEVEAAFHEIVTDILPELSPGAITGDKHLKALGADSVDRVEIILALMDRFGVTEPMASFSEIPDIDRLLAFLTEKRTR